MKWALAMATLAALLVPAHARLESAQQDKWEEQVRAQLDASLGAARGMGLHRTHDPIISTLHANSYKTYTVTLRSSHKYAITAVCDNDCNDIDLKIFHNGALVGEDVEKDDTPVVSVEPEETGEFNVRVIMVNCSSEPCRFGVGIYGTD